MKTARFRGILLVTLATAVGCAGRLKVGENDAGAGGKEPEAEGGIGGMTTEAGGRAGSTPTAGLSNGPPPVPDQPTPPTADSSEGCPPQGPLVPDTACDTVGLSCEYTPSSEIFYYEACNCLPVAGSGPVWTCDWIRHNAQCPPLNPGDGTSCEGSFSARCTYPAQFECSCPSEEVWNCEKLPILEPPSSPGPDQSLSQLTDQDRDQLCGWLEDTFNGGHGYPSLLFTPVDNPGQTTISECYVGDQTYCPQLVPHISRAQCVSNLKLSTCAAKVSTLTACVLGVFTRACSATEHSCNPYLAVPGCAGTLVVDGAALGCGLRLE